MRFKALTLCFIAAISCLYVLAAPVGIRNGSNTVPTSGNYRNPLMKFSSFDRITTNTVIRSANGEVYDGWLDVTGGGWVVTNYTTASVTNSAMIQTLANTQRTNFLYNSSIAGSIDQSILIETQFRNANFAISWLRLDPTVKMGIRAYTLNTNEFLTDVCSNSVVLETSIQHPMTLITNGQSIIIENRAKPTATNTTLVITKIWKKDDWQAVPQLSPIGNVTNNFTNAAIRSVTRGVGLTASKFVLSTFQNAIFNTWVYDNTAINSIPQAGTVSNTTFNLCYAGSSTWTVGSPTVPTQIHQNLTNIWAGATFTTINGAVSGSTTATWLPGQTNNDNLKTSVQAATGRKILRIMLGSNDAMNGVSTATWLANMQAIINDAWTWSVDDIIVEEIGVRVDGGFPYITLIKGYNEARNQLYGCRLGKAATHDSQATHINLLSGDSIHQTAAGGTLLATNQALEIKIP